MINLCKHCNKKCQFGHNYCSWECIIEEAKEAGGTVHQPNGLPIKYIDSNNNMWEIEGAEHPDYKFPLLIEYIENDLANTPMEGDDLENATHETHALIYTDDCVALTMYEKCYAVWNVKSGKYIGGSLWNKNWAISKKSLDKLQKFCQDHKVGI